MLKKIVLATVVVSAIASIAPSASANGTCEVGLPGCEPTTPMPQSVPEPSAMAGLILGGGFVAQKVIRARQRKG